MVAGSVQVFCSPGPMAARLGECTALVDINVNVHCSPGSVAAPLVDVQPLLTSMSSASAQACPGCSRSAASPWVTPPAAEALSLQGWLQGQLALLAPCSVDLTARSQVRLQTYAWLLQMWAAEGPGSTGVLIPAVLGRKHRMADPESLPFSVYVKYYYP